MSVRFTHARGVCGYYRPVADWGCGKKEEFRQRLKFGVNEALKTIDTVSVDYHLANKVTPESLLKQAVAM